MAVANIRNLHAELTEWHNNLGFYADEIKVYEKQLEEVVSNNTGQAILAQAEHFQNQFILQKEQFDILQHAIHLQEQAISGKALSGGSLPDNSGQDNIKNKMVAASELFEQLKSEFRTFLSEVL